MSPSKDPGETAEFERRTWVSLAPRLVACSTVESLAEALETACAKLFAWDAFVFSERLPHTEKFIKIRAIDTINGIPKLDTSPSEPYTSRLDFSSGNAISIFRKGEVTEKLRTFGDASRPSASLLFAPIVIEGQIFGIISVQSYFQDAFDANDCELLRALADFAAPALRRIQAERALHQNIARYRGAIAQADAASYERDFATHEFKHMGERIYDLTGYTAEEMTSELWASLIQEVALQGDARKNGFENAMKQVRSGETRVWKADYRIRTKDGRERWLADSSIALVDKKGQPYASLGILQDVTERMELLKLNQALSDLGRNLSEAKTPREAALIIAKAAEELIAFDAFYITLYSEKEGKTYSILNIDLDSETGTKHEYPSIYGKATEPSALFRRTMEEGFFIIDREKTPEAPAFLTKWGNQRVSACIMNVALRQHGANHIGVMSMQSYSPGAFTEESLRRAQILGDHCAGALQRVFAEERLQASERRGNVLATLAHQLNSVEIPYEAGLKIVQAADEVLGWDASFLMLYDNEKDVLIPIFHTDTVDGKRQEVGGITSYKPSGSVADVIQNGKKLILRQPDEETEKLTHRFGNKDKRSESLLYIPIRRGEAVIGVLSIQSYQTNAYTEADLEFLELLGEHCSGALERVRITAELKDSEKRYALAALGSNDALWDWGIKADQLYVSPRWREMLGYEKDVESLEEWFTLVLPEDIPLIQETLGKHLSGETPLFTAEYRVRHADGRYVWVHIRGQAVRDIDGQAVRMAGSMTDISDRKVAEGKLERAAFHDALTGLPNRALFTDRLHHSLARRKRQKYYDFAVLFMDLDRFKMVNDTLGHQIGDKLLQGVAERLIKSTREGDTVARLGGDEFTVILDDIKDPEESVRVANRIIDSLSDVFLLDGEEIFTNASIGIAASSAGYESVQDIIRDADIALYRAKDTGRGRCVVFDQEMHEKVVQSLEVENGLRRAMQDGGLWLAYQPIFSLADESVRGFEALIRWNDPQRGLIEPNEFISIAEESGQMVPIGNWVLREAHRQLAEWQSLFPKAKKLFVTVNISPRQFHAPSLAQTVDDLMKEQVLTPGSLQLEITESAIMDDLAHVKETLARWKEYGIRVFLDDFGTGHSSLASLIDLPVDYLKIDRSFVSGSDEKGGNRHVIRAVLSLARVLNLMVVAEGAETQEHIDTLRDCDCDYVQGFFLSKPLPPKEVEKYLVD